MSLPTCPKCHGSAVNPDPFSAGHNVCACGHRARVRDFHSPDASPWLEFSMKQFDRLQSDIRSAMFDPITQERAKRHHTVNVLDTPKPRHKPVKHWSDN